MTICGSGFADEKKSPKADTDARLINEAELIAAMTSKRLQAAPKLWIGIHGRPIDGVVKAHLNIDSGVAVLGVMKGSPAEAAGVKVHDILLSIGKVVVNDVTDLFEPIKSSQGKELELKIIRSSKTQILTVKPHSRPDTLLQEAKAQQNDWMATEIELIKLKGQHSKYAQDLDLILTGIKSESHPRYLIVDQVLVGEVEVPKGVTVTVKKIGGQPAEIVIERDEIQWTVKEGGLAKLPADIRKYVGAVFRDGNPNYAKWLDVTLRPQPQAGAKKVISVDFPVELIGRKKKVEGSQKALQESLKSVQLQLEQLRALTQELSNKIEANQNAEK
jgi:hypothetical protein